MKKFALLLTLCLIIALAPNAFAADMKEGDWEINMSTTMTGMPFQMPPQNFKMTQCVTKEDMVPQDKNRKGCTVTDQKVVGNTVSWKVVCEDATSKSDGDGRITHSGTAYNGIVNTNITDKRQGGTMRMATKLNGRYLGPCSAASKAEADRLKAMR